MLLVLLNTFKRFSLAGLCSIFTCLYLFDGSIVRLIFSDQYIVYMALGILWFIASALWIEQNRLQQKVIFTIASFFMYVAFSWYVQNMYQRLDFVILAILFSFIALIFVAFSHKDDDHLWQFQFLLIKQFIYVSFLNFILLLGTLGILGALDYLLDFILYKNQYFDVGNIIGTLVLPFSFMASIHQNVDKISGDAGESNQKWLLKVMSYICIPFLSIYAVILHLYAIKIFFLPIVPQGRIGYLVIVFCMMTVLVYLIVGRFKKNNEVIRLFCAFAGWFLLIPLGLLVWGLYTRIVEFGLTEFRYFAGLLGVVIFMSAICMILRIRSVYIVSIFSILLLGSVMINYQQFIARDHLHRLQSAYHQKNNKGIDDALFYLGQIKKLDDVFTLPEFAVKKPQKNRFYVKDVKSAIMKK